MKVAILAGGYGTRLSEETELRPKPMVEIGGKPILWHIMRHFAHYGFNDFVILGGYKSYMIKEYFLNYGPHRGDFTIDMRTGKTTYHSNSSEDWKVTVLDTGMDVMTGGRILRAREHLLGQPFFLTYGDGVADVNLHKLVEFHKARKAALTLTTIQPEARFGILEFGKDDQVLNFSEKPKGDGTWINAGFFVCEAEVFKVLDKGDETIFERSPMEALAAQRKLYAYRHRGFWKCMDTLRDKVQLETMWQEKQVAWQI